MEMFVTEAMQSAIEFAMKEDPAVIVLGEDVERGAFGVEKGLYDTFGPRRVRNTPISEATVLGTSVGAAACGLKPVFDLMFSSFFYVAFDQVANQAARLRYMSGGQVQVPMVMIAVTGPGGSAAAQHSENPHAMLMQTSGIKVVMPSTAGDAAGLLLTSIRDPNPVAFLIDVSLMGNRGEVADPLAPIPFGKAATRRTGTDVTVVAFASAVDHALTAAEELDGDVSVEVIDPRTLVPFDWDAVYASVEKTGRLVVVEPGRQTCGAAAEVVTKVVENCFSNLRTAPSRVTWPDVPVPYSPPLESEVLTSSAKVRDAVLKVVGE